MNRAYTDRSRILGYQRCPRRRWHEYHDGPERLGIVPRKTPLPLVVGGAVHAGQAVLLRVGSELYAGLLAARLPWESISNGWRECEEQAVAAALAEFRARTGDRGLELDLSEGAAQQAAFTDLEAQLRGTLALPDDELSTRVQDAKQRADAYLAREQEALVEALVRAYARRRLRPLLEQYEVLEVEREGQWLLTTHHDERNMLRVGCRTCGYAGPPFEGADSAYDFVACPNCNHTATYYHAETDFEIWFASRPDALLRDRESNQLYILSYKTAATWDVRKERDAERDMQGLSEGVEVEKRLQDWWTDIHHSDRPSGQWTPAMWQYLHGLDSPPRILGIRYEYLFKSYRGKDKDLTREMGMDMWVQKSHLVRRYRCVSTPAKGKNAGAFAVGDVAWAYEFHLEDGSESKLAWQNWRSEPVWEQAGGVKAWIDQLDATAEAMSSEDASSGFEPRALGWSGPAQAVGFTGTHPLDEVFHPPLIIYRNDDQLRDWFQQIEAQERKVAQDVERVHAEPDIILKHELLNTLFIQYRQSCEYPGTCPYASTKTAAGPCFGPEHVQADPMGTGRYRVRTPNHPAEVEK